MSDSGKYKDLFHYTDEERKKMNECNATEEAFSFTHTSPSKSKSATFSSDSKS